MPCWRASEKESPAPLSMYQSTSSFSKYGMGKFPFASGLTIVSSKILTGDAWRPFYIFIWGMPKNIMNGRSQYLEARLHRKSKPSACPREHFGSLCACIGGFHSRRDKERRNRPCRKAWCHRFALIRLPSSSVVT